MNLGSIICRGSPQEVLQNPLVVDEYLGTGDGQKARTSRRTRPGAAVKTRG